MGNTVRKRDVKSSQQMHIISYHPGEMRYIEGYCSCTGSNTKSCTKDNCYAWTWNCCGRYINDDSGCVYKAMIF